MFHKIRFRLTLLSGGITTLILIIMTLGYLYISEKNLLENKLLSYENDINTIATNLEQQNMLTHTWLSKLEADGKYYISVLDNQVPFLYNSMKNQNSHEMLFEQAWLYYREQKEFLSTHTISYRTHYSDFFFKNSTNEDYRCFVITLSENNTCLEMLIIAPLEALNNQIMHQRLVFLTIVTVSDLILWVFSWFFTGKLLYPIEESRKKQNQFVASASHELRTPLAVILSCSEGLLEKSSVVDSSIEITKELSAIKNESLRMSRLLEDMLTLSSSDTNQFSINKSPVELDTLLLDAYEIFEPMAKSKNQKLHINLPEELLPSCSCDKERIYQVLAILLHNAISYTPQNGSIHIKLEMIKDNFSISVSDTGIGIPHDEKKKIFDRFYRSEKSRSAKGHFGLGLAIAYEIVKSHNGSITVSDTPNGGATFTIIL